MLLTAVIAPVYSASRPIPTDPDASYHTYTQRRQQCDIYRIASFVFFPTSRETFAHQIRAGLETYIITGRVKTGHEEAGQNRPLTAGFWDPLNSELFGLKSKEFTDVQTAGNGNVTGNIGIKGTRLVASADRT